MRLKRITIQVDESTRNYPVKAYIKYAIVGNVINSKINPIVYEEALRIIKDYSERYDIHDIKNHYMIRVYRDYLWKLKIDPTKTRPSHEALLRRVLRTHEFPRINTIVDIGNLMSLKYLVPIGLYDLNKVNPPLLIRSSVSGDLFHPIGSDLIKEIPPGRPLLTDREKVIHIFPSRDSRLTSIDLSTNSILITVIGVEGVPLTTVSKALDNLIDYIVRYTAGENKIVRMGKVIWFGGI